MYLREIFDRERENIIMIFLTLLTYLSINQFDQQKLQETGLIFLIYVIWILLNYLYGIQMILPRININPSKEYYDEKYKDLTDGRKFYGFLDVKIPYNWVITECYVTLERVTPIYYEDRILLNEKFSDWFSKNIKPEYKMLHWRSPLSGQEKTKINIGENSNKEPFSVGKIITGKFGEIKINTFCFDVQQKNPAEIVFNQFGLYEFTIMFHWKRFGRDMLPRKVKGYIYSRSTNSVREIFVGVGSYINNEKIPKPLINNAGDDK